MRTPLQKGEKVILVTHRSWTSLILPALIALIGCVASYLIGFIDHYGWIAAVLGILYFLWKYYTWKLYIWVVTSHRVIDEFGLIGNYAKESPLDKINNVTYKQTLMGKLFNFGNVEIQTAAQAGATTYYNVNHPRRLKDTITATQLEYQHLQFAQQARYMADAMNERNQAMPYAANPAPAHTAPAIAAELEKLFDLKQKGALSEEEYLRAKNRLLGH